MHLPHHELAQSRRDFLLRAGGGFGALALSSLLGHGETRIPQRLAKAKSCIFLFMEGGPSHIDLFDPKPDVNRLAGERLPESFGTVLTAMGEQGSPILECKRQWAQHGQSGTWVSDWLPHTATIVDDISVIRSCHADGLNHVGSVCQMNTGSVLAGRPSLGSWVNYGLGSENDNLPAFVVMTDNEKKPFGGTRNWGTGFMPSKYQGTQFAFGDEPVTNLKTRDREALKRQRKKLDFIRGLNEGHRKHRGFQSDLEARIKAYELAFRMQTEVPEATDLDDEPQHIRQSYGLDQEHTAAMARNCIMARRLVERGVRFIQVYSGTGSKWDAHAGIEKNHSTNCAAMDQPVTALVRDLKQRGLLDETLVVWGGEFGRTPMSEKGNGRDHNPWGFTMWMAGGGVKGGQTIGSTDSLGLRAEEDPLHIHDLHATVLHAMGLDNRELHYLHNGRRESPTINEGDPCLKLFG